MKKHELTRKRLYKKYHYDTGDLMHCSICNEVVTRYIKIQKINYDGGCIDNKVFCCDKLGCEKKLLKIIKEARQFMRKMNLIRKENER